MIVDNTDALMIWLTAALEPMCDADPGALAKYVLALIKKDKADDDLKKIMEQQMDVFLQHNTVKFIDDLFATLANKDYLDGPPKTNDTSRPADTETDQAETTLDSIDEGNPDSTTTPGSRDGHNESFESDGKPAKKLPEDDRARRRGASPRERRNSSPRRRRTPPRRHRSRSRSPAARIRRSPERRRRSPPPFGRRSRSFSPPRRGNSPPRRYSPAARGEDDVGYTPTATGAKRQRCRDYDEKGFCMRGDQCKFDHGNDAVVLEDSTNTSVPPPPYMPGGYAEPYVPVLPPLHLPPPGFANVSRKRGYAGEEAADIYPPTKRFDYNRIGRGRGRGGRGRGSRPLAGSLHHGSAQLTVRNIPPALNTIAHLNNHFARFGTLVNVQVHFGNDPASALVTFTHPTEATAAMNSSEAVMGNRFIKMFYHSDRSTSIKDRLGDKVTEEVSSDGKTTITKTIVNVELQKTADPELETAKENQKAAAIAAIKKNQEVLETKAKMKKAADEKKVEMVKKTEELRKSKQELLDNLIEEQKKLILKIEAKKSSARPEEKSAMMALVKSLTASIDKTKEDIKHIIEQQATHTTRRKSFSDIQRDLLDAELELFNAQQDGSDVADVQRRISILRVEAAQKGYLPTSRPPRGRGRGSHGFRGAYGMRGSPRGFRGIGGFRGRGGRGSAFVVSGTTSVDRRPTKIMVSGYEPEEKDELLAHMAKFGELADHVVDDATPSVVVHYKTRREAEAAMAKAKEYGDRSLQLSWYSGSGDATDDHAELDHDTSSGLDETADLLLDDDYTPLDPAYLPPGLEDDVGSTKADEKPSEGKAEGVSEELLEEEEDDEEGERSWKR